MTGAQLTTAVIDELAVTDRPLKAREIASRLRRKGFSVVDRSQVNSVLYGLQGRTVSRDEQYRWALLSGSTGDRVKNISGARGAPGRIPTPGGPAKARKPSSATPEIEPAAEDPKDPFEALAQPEQAWIPFELDQTTTRVDPGQFRPNPVRDLFDQARPASWLTAQLTGVWRLVYEVGGPRSRLSPAVPASLPPEVATAWAVWTGRADDDEDLFGGWEVSPLDTLPEARGYRLGEEWRRWVPRFRAPASGDSLGESPTIANADDFEIFRTYLERYPVLQNVNDDNDPHYAERLFLTSVAIPLLGSRVLDLLKAQVSFRDPEGKPRLCDFVLHGQKTYAIEVEGYSFHAAPFVTATRFAEERRRVQAFAGLGWNHLPVAFADLASGMAFRTFSKVLGEDAELAPLLEVSRGAATADEPAAEPDELVLSAFSGLQAVLLALYSHAESAGLSEVAFHQEGMDFPLVEMAVRDLDLLGSLVCELYGLSWSRPSIELKVNTGNRSAYLRSLAAFHGSDLQTAGVDNRVDRPSELPAPLRVSFQSSGQSSTDGSVVAGLTLGQFGGGKKLILTDLSRLPPLPVSADAGLVRRPVPERASPRRLDAFARRLFWVPYLREEQVELVQRALRLESLLGVLPTGFGKSLCFQLPAYLSTGTCLVVSPLKSLMRDQWRGLAVRGLGAADFISSDLSLEEKNLVLSRLLRGQLKILYLSPERLQIEQFARPLLATIEDSPISYLAVDEAHCVSEWGHDFRPAYLRLSELTGLLGKGRGQLPILGFTATASEPVRRDIVRVLSIPPESVVQSKSVDRPEISLSVHRVEDGRKTAVTADLVRQAVPTILGKEPGCFDRSNAEDGSLLLFSIYAAAVGKTTRAESVAHIRAGLVQAGLDPDAVRLHASRQPPICASCGSHNILGSRSKRTKRYETRCEDCGAVHRTAETDISWSEELIRTQEDFLSDRFPTLVATKGFGMGIDKPNIRATIHHCMPGGLEALYQEGGRAGRDGDHAHMALLWRPPSESCVERYFRRYPKAGDESGTTSADHLMPPCIRDPSSRMFRKCPEGLEVWCDYGRQAEFIASSFPEAGEQSETAAEIYRRLLESAPPRHVDARNTGRRANANRIELALFRLRLLGVVSAIWVSYRNHLRTKRFHVVLSDSWDAETSLQALRDYLAGFEADQELVVQQRLAQLEASLRSLSEPPATGPHLPPVEWVHAAVQTQTEHSLLFIMQMRYRMLHNLWRYAHETEERGQCRRWFITTQLDESEFARPEDHRCEFCDVCCSSRPLTFGDRARASVPTEEWRHRDLAEQVVRSVSDDAFESLNGLLGEATNAELSLRNLALHHLEANPRSLGAHYLAARASQVASRRGERRDEHLSRDAAEHASAGFRRVEATTADRETLEPFVSVLEQEDPGHCLDLLDRKDGPFDDWDGAKRVKRLRPHLDPVQQADQLDRVDRALAAAAAEKTSDALRALNDQLAGLALEVSP